MVGFEGTRDRICVVPKKLHLTREILGSDSASSRVDACFATFKLNFIFNALACVSVVTLLVTLATVHVSEKAWYWLVVVGGMWMWMTFYSACSSLLLRRLCLGFGACRWCEEQPTEP